ncbi:MAG: nucleotidyltransferase domain-containing protein [Candidatus ainarchaeum sp.]|nr:nucleotidyltransferase domain-containing protein [Candidatus ainarchaeum sp.]
MMEQYAVIKAMEKLTSHPEKKFSVRGLAAEAGISPGASKAALDYMRERRIVNLEIVGKTYQYRADLESPLCRQWKVLFNLEQLRVWQLVKEITEKLGNVHAILLYGSMGQGTNDQKSDADLLVIAHKPKKVRFDFARSMGREANITVMSMAEWKLNAAKNKVFYENVVYDSIVLHGKRPVIL